MHQFWKLPGIRLLLCLGLLGCGGRVDRLAQSAFLAEGGQAGLTILPAVLRSGEELRHDAQEAERLASGLSGLGVLAEAGVGEAPLSPGWKMSGDAMCRRSAQEFRRWIRQHPTGSRYVVLPEYQLGTRMVAGVCLYVVDAQGRLAYARRFDSNDRLYQDMAPLGPRDCTNLLISALHEILGAQRP